MHAPTPTPGAPPAQSIAAEMANGGRTVQQYLKDVGLFFAAPFVTLAYLVLFPFMGLGLLVLSARKRRAWRRSAPR